MKYTFIELQILEEDLKDITDLDKDLSFEYVYGVRKILSQIKEFKELIRECLKDNDESYNSYVDELFELASEHGAEINRNQMQRSINFESEDFDKEAFEEDKEELDERYEEALEIAEYNNDILQNKEVEVDLPKISISAFSETVSFDELPDSLLPLIKEESND